MTLKISRRALARELGVAHSALAEAIKSGRVTWPPASTEAARAQWVASSAVQGPAPLADRGEVDRADGVRPDETLAELRRRKERALTLLRETELMRVRVQLCLRAGIERKLIGIFSECRTKLLGIPSRAKQAMPELSVAQIIKLDDLVREALEALADQAGPAKSIAERTAAEARDAGKL